MTIKTGIVLYVAIYLLLFFKKFKGQKTYRIFINTIFFIYMCMVAEVAFFPMRVSLGYSKVYLYDYGSIMSFKDLILSLTTHTRSLHESIKDIVLNTIMLMPFGFLFPIVFHKKKLRTIILFTFALSLFIESAQFLLTISGVFDRAFDTTDIITNTIGGCIGFVIFKIFQPLIVKLANDKTHSD